MSEKKPIEKDAVDTSLVAKMAEMVENGPGVFRTIEHVDPITGDKTRIRTKGGNPQAVVDKKEVAPQRQGCPKPPFIEVGFKYAAEPGTDPARNPYTVVSGYRTWHGEPNPSIPISPTNPKKVIKYNFSSDGVFCMKARKPKRLTFKDANNKKVEMLFAERPHSPDDATNEENQDYAGSGSGTFENVAIARASSQGTDAADFKFSEGRYKYRQWFNPELIDPGYAFKFVPKNLFQFVIRRLRQITMLSINKGSAVTKLLTWTFTEKATPAYTGTPSNAACADQNLREVSFSNRQYFSPNGHLKEVTMRAKYSTSLPSAGETVKFEFKRPGSFLMNIDPESIIPGVGGPDVTHPGADASLDLSDFSAWGNPYHGFYHYVIAAGSGTAKLYTDSSKTTEVTMPFSPKITITGDIKYFNFQNIGAPTSDEHVTRVQNVDGSYKPEKFYKDAIFQDGSTFPTWNTGETNYARLADNEVLYKDPAGTVWTFVVDALPYYVGPASLENLYFSAKVSLVRQYGDIETNFDWNNDGFGTGKTRLKDFYLGIPAKSMFDFGFTGNGGAPTFWFKDESIEAYWYWANCAIVPRPDGKECLMLSTCGEWLHGIRDGGGKVLQAVRIVFSGTGAIEADPDNSIAIGDGISVSASIMPINDGNFRESRHRETFSTSTYVVNPENTWDTEIVAHSRTDVVHQITCHNQNTGQDDVFSFPDWSIPREHGISTPPSYGWWSHSDYDYFWNGETWVPVSIRYTWETASHNETTVGSWVDYSVVHTNIHCTTPAGATSDIVFTDSSNQHIEKSGVVQELKVALLVNGAIVHEIGLRLTYSGTYTNVPEPPFIWMGNLRCTYMDTDIPTVTTLDGTAVTLTLVSKPDAYSSTMDFSLVPIAKAIPQSVNYFKKKKGSTSGTGLHPEWERSVATGATYKTYGFTLVYEGRTAADDTATSGKATKLIYKDGVLETTMGSFQPVPFDATYDHYTANTFAYNPRTKEIVLVPYTDVAGFI